MSILKIVGNYYVDENNNKWNKSCYTKEEATMWSKALINCYDCKNCNGCYDCSGCRDCNGCHACHNCNNCNYCNCCNYCRDCSDCNYCHDCLDCSDCSYCSNCRDCNKNPWQYITAKIGRRKSATHFYWTNKDDVRVVCGCFRGNLEAFEKAVLKTHENNKTHREAYLKEIEKVKTLIR